MKKLYLAVVLASVSTIALAQSVSPANEIIKMVKGNVMSSDVEYKSEPSVRPIAKGFEVSIPDGVTKAGGQVVSGFSFPVMEGDDVGANKSYVIKLDKMSYIFPTFEKILTAKKVSYSKVNYVAKFIPALSFIESQEISLNDLKAPFENNLTLSVSSMHFSDMARMLSDTKVKQEDKASMNGINLAHPLGAVTVKSLDFSVSVPETSKAQSPLEQMMKTPHVEENMSLDDVKISSSFPGKDGTINFNLKQSLDMKQDMNNQNLTVSFNLNLDDIRQTGAVRNLPSQITMDIEATGFTIEQLMNLSDANDKMSEAGMLMESPRKEVIMKSVQKELDAAADALLTDMKIDVNKIAVDADEYAIVLKGKVVPESESFKGTLQITNFEYLAPEPKKIDEAVCRDLETQMMENKINIEEFKVRYEASCDEGRGRLDALRPFASTALKVKDEKGNDALQFKIEMNGDDLFINDQKFNDEMLNPASFLGN